MIKYIIGVIILLLLDFSWIYFYMGPRYKMLIKNIQSSNMETNIHYAALSYLLMVIGLIWFIIPKLEGNDIFKESLNGLLFGIILYGVYDFTAAAVLKNWDIKLAIKDILWGGFVYFITSLVTSFYIKYNKN